MRRQPPRLILLGGSAAAAASALAADARFVRQSHIASLSEALLTAPALARDDLLLEAATLAAMILRFEERAAHQPSTHTPAGVPVIGQDAYVFPPSSRRIPRDQIPAFLAALPCPAFLAPTTMRGTVTLTLLQELSGERRASIQHNLDNQVSILQDMASGPDTDRVLLAFDDQVHLFTLGAVRLWASRFGILVGWNITPSNDTARAEWQMHLFSGSGHRTARRE